MENKVCYAKHHGYTMVLGRAPATRMDFEHTKIRLIETWLPLTDVLVWIEPNATIADFSRAFYPIMDYSERDILINDHNKEIGGAIMVIRNTQWARGALATWLKLVRLAKPNLGWKRHSYGALLEALMSDVPLYVEGGRCALYSNLKDFFHCHHQFLTHEAGPFNHSGTTARHTTHVTFLPPSLRVLGYRWAERGSRFHGWSPTLAQSWSPRLSLAQGVPSSPKLSLLSQLVQYDSLGLGTVGTVFSADDASGVAICEPSLPPHIRTLQSNQSLILSFAAAGEAEGEAAGCLLRAGTRQPQVHCQRYTNAAGVNIGGNHLIEELDAFAYMLAIMRGRNGGSRQEQQEGHAAGMTGATASGLLNQQTAAASSVPRGAPAPLRSAAVELPQLPHAILSLNGPSPKSNSDSFVAPGNERGAHRSKDTVGTGRFSRSPEMRERPRQLSVLAEGAMSYYYTLTMAPDVDAVAVGSLEITTTLNVSVASSSSSSPSPSTSSPTAAVVFTIDGSPPSPPVVSDARELAAVAYTAPVQVQLRAPGSYLVRAVAYEANSSSAFEEGEAHIVWTAKTALNRSYRVLNAGAWDQVPAQSTDYPWLLRGETSVTPLVNGDTLVFPNTTGTNMLHGVLRYVVNALPADVPTESATGMVIDPALRDIVATGLTDVDYFDGQLYGGVSGGGSAIATGTSGIKSRGWVLVYSANNLTFTGRAFTTMQTSVPWVAVDANRRVLYSSEQFNVSRIYAYPLDRPMEAYPLLLDRMVQNITGGVIFGSQLYLAVGAQGLDHECDRLVLDLPRSVPLEACGTASHFPEGPSAKYNFSDAARLQLVHNFTTARSSGSGASHVHTSGNVTSSTRLDTHVCTIAQVLSTRYYGKCRLRDRRPFNYGDGVAQVAGMQWSAVQAVARNEPVLRSDGQHTGSSTSVYLRIVKDVPALPLSDKLYTCYSDNQTTCARILPTGGIATATPWWAHATAPPPTATSMCPFANVASSPCYDYGNPCQGAGCIAGGVCPLGDAVATSAYVRCEAMVASHCAAHPTDPPCATAVTDNTPFPLPSTSSCPYQDVSGSPCFTEQSACRQSNAFDQPSCLNEVQSYCASGPAASDPGCAHKALPGAPLTSQCPFENVPGSPCYDRGSEAPCIGPGMGTSSSCVSRLQSYCQVNAPGADTDTLLVLNTAGEPACSNWQWWWRRSVCPFNQSDPDSPCYTGGGACLQSHCALRMSSWLDSNSTDPGYYPWAVCDNMTTPFVQDTVNSNVQLTAACHSEIENYCGAVNPDDPHCAYINGGCGLPLEGCAFDNVPGSPCCNDGNSPCIATNSSAEKCEAFIHTYCRARNPADQGCLNQTFVIRSNLPI